MNRTELHSFYIRHLTEQVLPFWKKAVDPKHGGVFTGFDNRGEALLHRDKFTWSQGRFLWIWSRIGDLCRRGVLNEEAETYFREAKRTYEFIDRHVYLPDGSCRFLLTEAGEPLESIPGEGQDISFYADCFVVMGNAEYARANGQEEAYRKAGNLFEHVERRVQAGTARSEPYPIPAGCEAHGYAMILLNSCQALADAAEGLGRKGEADAYRGRAQEYARRIVSLFTDSSKRIREVIPAGRSEDAPRTLLLSHLNPGHSVESLWFVLTEAEKAGDREMIEACSAALKKALSMGWDREHGGLLRYVDLDGGVPAGDPHPGAERFEALIKETWDMKLWWPHSEALYACQLAYQLTDDISFLEWYDLVHAYTFRTFPAEEGMEWIQIRTRKGKPVDRVVALPVKDPYHIIRNLLLLIERTSP